MTFHASSLKVSKTARQTLAMRAAQNGTTVQEEADAALVRSLGATAETIIECAYADAQRELPTALQARLCLLGKGRARIDAFLLSHLGFTAWEVVSCAVEQAMREESHQLRAA